MLLWLVMQDGLLSEVEWLVNLLDLRHNYVAEAHNCVSVKLPAEGKIRSENISPSKCEFKISTAKDNVPGKEVLTALDSERQRRLGVLQGIGKTCHVASE